MAADERADAVTTSMHSAEQLDTPLVSSVGKDESQISSAREKDTPEDIETHTEGEAIVGHVPSISLHPPPLGGFTLGVSVVADVCEPPAQLTVCERPGTPPSPSRKVLALPHSVDGAGIVGDTPLTSCLASRSGSSDSLVCTKAVEHAPPVRLPNKRLSSGGPVDAFADAAGKVMMQALDSITVLASKLEEDVRVNPLNGETAEIRGGTPRVSVRPGGRVSSFASPHPILKTPQSLVGRISQVPKSRISHLPGMGLPGGRRTPRVSAIIPSVREKNGSIDRDFCGSILPSPSTMSVESSLPYGEMTPLSSREVPRADSKDKCLTYGVRSSALFGPDSKIHCSTSGASVPTLYATSDAWNHFPTIPTPTVAGSTDTAGTDTSNVSKTTSHRHLANKSGLIKLLQAGDIRQDVDRSHVQCVRGSTGSVLGVKGTFWDIISRASRRKENVEILVDQAVVFIVFLNVITLALSSDVHPGHHAWLVMDVFFAVAFLAEFLFKLRLLGCRVFFCGLQKWWNLVEFSLVVLAWFEVLMALLPTSDDGDVSVSTFRIVRIVRITRIVRIAKLPMMTDLVMMINGAVGGLKTLLWAGVLIAVPLFVVGLVFRETIGRDKTLAGNENFRSLPVSVFTLFRCVVAADCTDSEGKPIFVTVSNAGGYPYAVIYTITMLLMTFGLFNVIVAIYVENTVAAAKYNDLHLKRQRLRDQKVFSRKACEMVEIIWHLLNEIQPDELLSIGQDERERLGDDPHAIEIVSQLPHLSISADFFDAIRLDRDFRELLKDLDIAEDDQMELFDTLDVDGSGIIDLSELIFGIKKLRGDPRRADVIANNLMSYTILQVCESIEESFSACRLEHEQHAQRIDDALATLSRR